MFQSWCCCFGLKVIYQKTFCLTFLSFNIVSYLTHLPAVGHHDDTFVFLDISWNVVETQHGCYFQVLIQADVVPGSGVLLAAGDDDSKEAIAVE
jgi:hypothetical protein